MIVDTHCHLNSEQLAGDVEGAIARAEAARVERLVVVGFDMPSSEQAVRLAEAHSQVWAAVAVHPHDARHYDPAAEDRLRALARHERVVAIGEIGLDYHYDFSPRQAQIQAFRAQIGLAREVGLPLIIHCREAYSDVLDILETEAAGVPSIVMHCWAGALAEAERALALGMFLGIGGVVTFKNAETLREVVRAAPEDRLLLETDAPYLAPAPHRGKRNEPAYTALVAAKVAEVRGVPLERVIAATTANAERVFPRLRSTSGPRGPQLRRA
jgi:TatD DNase family protein